MVIAAENIGLLITIFLRPVGSKIRPHAVHFLSLRAVMASSPISNCAVSHELAGINVSLLAADVPTCMDMNATFAGCRSGVDHRSQSTPQRDATRILRDLQFDLCR